MFIYLECRTSFLLIRFEHFLWQEHTPESRKKKAAENVACASVCKQKPMLDDARVRKLTYEEKHVYDLLMKDPQQMFAHPIGIGEVFGDAHTFDA